MRDGIKLGPGSSVLLLVGALASPVVQAQSTSHPKTSPTPRWDVVSVKPHAPSARRVPVTVTPARIEFHCVNVIGLIRLAYDAQMPNPFVSSDRDPVSGGPGWIKTDNFEIVAKAEGTPSGNAMVGPMLQSILEDRFRLRIRPETRVVPVYELIIAKNGFKKTGFKMEPVAEGFRTPFDAFESRAARSTLYGTRQDGGAEKPSRYGISRGDVR
jgi:uncharacterized protein (TIGR03435 family)